MATMRKEDVKTEWEKPNDHPLNNLSSEEIKEVLTYRSNLLNEAAEYYKKFVEAIYKLPIHVVYRQHAFLNIDQGWHWAEKGMDNVWSIPKETKEEVSTETTKNETTECTN